MGAVEDGVRILQASKEWGVPVTTLSSHVFGKTTTSKRGRAAGVLTKKEEDISCISLRKWQALDFL